MMTIKAFNNDKMIEPFKIDMKLADLSDLMTIYSNFAFNLKITPQNCHYQKQPVVDSSYLLPSARHRKLHDEN
jgi:hypothetical protein